MTHTPGPWIVDRSMCGELEPFDKHGRHLLNSAGPLPLKRREANACLIAAAPDLLACLNDAYEELNFDGTYTAEEMTRTIDAVRERMARAIDAVRERMARAIDKAERGTS